MMSKIKITCERIQNCKFDVQNLPDSLYCDKPRVIYMTSLLINYVRFLIEKDDKEFE